MQLTYGNTPKSYSPKDRFKITKREHYIKKKFMTIIVRNNSLLIIISLWFDEKNIYNAMIISVQIHDRQFVLAPFCHVHDATKSDFISRV